MKKILSVLLCVALLLALAACDPAPPTEPQGTTPSTNAPTEPAGFNVAGSYKFDPGDQNGLGVEYMLHEDGTYYIAEYLGVLERADRTERETEAVKAFAEWFGSAEVQAAWGEEFDSYPCNKGAADLLYPDGIPAILAAQVALAVWLTVQK